MRVVHIGRGFGRCAKSCRWTARASHPFSVQAGSSPAAAPSPPAATPPPPAASTPSSSASPPPPAANEPPPPAPDSSAAGTGTSGSLQCGGFFFAFDPNIGLWNDRVNPNWRLTFTDSQSNEKHRVPYAFAIQHKGPHFEFALRLQFGYVVCGAAFDDIPEKFDVESGWEVTLPLPLAGVRFCHTKICTGDAMGKPALATVYCVDLPIGFTAGVQKAAYGVGLKGKPELSWRGQFAMVAFVAALIWGIYNVVTLPTLWQDTIREILREEDDMDVAMFKALDVDGDGYITLPDVQQFVTQSQLSVDASELFRELDTEGTGRVNLDQFQDSLEALLEAQERLSASASTRPGNVELKPFGGIFTPGLAQPFGGGAFNPGLMPPMPGMPPRAKPPGGGFSEL